MHPLMLILIWLLALVLLGSCDLTPPSSDHCAGFKPITTTAATVDYLVAHDPELLKEITGHDEFGRKIGCWK